MVTTPEALALAMVSFAWANAPPAARAATAKANRCFFILISCGEALGLSDNEILETRACGNTLKPTLAAEQAGFVPTLRFMWQVARAPSVFRERAVLRSAPW